MAQADYSQSGPSLGSAAEVVMLVGSVAATVIFGALARQSLSWISAKLGSRLIFLKPALQSPAAVLVLIGLLTTNVGIVLKAFNRTFFGILDAKTIEGIDQWVHNHMTNHWLAWAVGCSLLAWAGARAMARLQVAGHTVDSNTVASATASSSMALGNSGEATVSGLAASGSSGVVGTGAQQPSTPAPPPLPVGPSPLLQPWRTPSDLLEPYGQSAPILPPLLPPLLLQPGTKEEPVDLIGLMSRPSLLDPTQDTPEALGKHDPPPLPGAAFQYN